MCKVDRPTTPQATPTVKPCPHCTVTKTSGGLSGNTLNVTFEACGCECDSLQAIQVVWVTRDPALGQLGKLEVTRADKKYDAFVDGGKNSPYSSPSQGGAAAHPTKPYYLTARELASGVTYSTSGDKGTIKVYDQPAAIYHFDEVYFETAIVCVNHQKSGKDKVLKVFTWGWKDKGTTYVTAPGNKNSTAGTLSEASSPSSDFWTVVSNDYPDYATH